MSKLKNELTAIREALDTEHEYSGDYALQEEVANIRKLVENGAGGESVGGNLIVTAPQGWALDKTWTEIVEAIRSGKSVYFFQDIGEYGVNLYPCVAAQMDDTAFKPYLVMFMYMVTDTQAAAVSYVSAAADGALEPAGGD